MTLYQSLILGIVQGLTEFLPISSSAHLVLTPFILGWRIPAQQAFVFDVLVQVATLVAVFAYFRRDLLAISRAVLAGILNREPFVEPAARLGWFLVLATIPAVIAGASLKNTVENTFNNPQLTALFLLGTAALLLIAERFGRRNRPLEKLTWKDALLVGFFQAMALFPGISRSGASITGGMVRDLERPAAARFSFLMSIPIMIAAGSIATLDLLKIHNLDRLLPTYLPGFFAAILVGYLAIRWLLSFLVRHPLYVFAIYCTTLSLVSLAFIFLPVRNSPPTPPPPPTPQPVIVAMTLPLKPLTEALNTCAIANPHMVLILNETPASHLDVNAAHLNFRLGEPPQPVNFTAPVAWEEIVVVTNPDNPVDALNKSELAALFRGQISRWDELGGLHLEVQVWVFPEGDDISQLVQPLILGGMPYTSHAHLVPDPTSMLEAVTTSPGAIGFLPRAWLNSEVKTVQVEEELRTALRHPVLSLSKSEPRHAARDLMLCLQSPYGQEVIGQKYQPWK